MMIDAPKLQRLIDGSKWDMSEFAEQAHISRGTLYNILKTGEIKKPRQLTRFAELLRVEESDIALNTEVQSVEKEKFYDAIPIEPADDDDPSFTAAGMEFREVGEGRFLMIIPLVDQHAYAGYPAGYKDREYIESLPKHSFYTDRIHSGIYRAFVVRGDSMDDGSREAICEGDIVDGRKLVKDLWKNKLHIREYPDFVIVHHDGVIIKRVVDHDVKNGIIYCTSLNPNKQLYPDKSYRLSEVYELYNIVSLQQKRRRR